LIEDDIVNDLLVEDLGQVGLDQSNRLLRRHVCEHLENVGCDGSGNARLGLESGGHIFLSQRGTVGGAPVA
jgi:hypothetical protein